MSIKIKNTKIREVLALKPSKEYRDSNFQNNNYYNINESLFLTNNKNREEKDLNNIKSKNRFPDINEVNYNDKNLFFKDINNSFQNASSFYLFSENRNKSLLRREENKELYNIPEEKTNESFYEIKRKCDICDENMDPNYPEYIHHLKNNHNIHLVFESIKDKFITDIIRNPNQKKIKLCDICDQKISFNIFDYIDHINQHHKSFLNKTLVKYVKDKYILSVIFKKDFYNLAASMIICDLCGDEIFDYKDFNEHKAKHKKNNKNSLYASVINSLNSKDVQVAQDRNDVHNLKVNINNMNSIKDLDMNDPKNLDFVNKNWMNFGDIRNISRECSKGNNYNFIENEVLKKRSLEILDDFYGDKDMNKDNLGDLNKLVDNINNRNIGI